MQSIKDSPKYTSHRTNVIAVDALPSTSRDDGTNFQGYDYGMVQVVPSGGADPSIELMEWNDQAGEFISANPKFERAGLGANKAYSFTFQALGRIMWVRVTAGVPAGSIDIFATGRVSGAI